MKNTIKMFVAVVAVISVIATAGCTKDPITGKDILLGSLEVINEYSAPLGAVAVWTEPGGTGECVWRNPSGLNVEEGYGVIWDDVPAGVWSVFVGGSTIDGVVIAVGMTTTVVRTSGGGLTAGLPH